MGRINRRDFIAGSLAAAVALNHSELLAAEATDLVEVTGTDVAAMVAAALKELGGIGKFVKKGDYVVLKPNAGFANPAEWGTTTHPDVVVAVARLCLEAKAKQVLVVEFPSAKGDKCLERCGLTAALASVPQVKVKVLSSPEDFQKVEIPKGVSLKSAEVAKALLSADVFINLAQAKAHNATGVSFGLKNHMGLIWDRNAFHTLLDLNQAVADLGTVVKPHLTFIDATRALLTNGPAGPGETATPGKIVAGRSIASVDAYGLTLARFNQKQMTLADAPHIALAGQAGLGETDLGKLKIKKVNA